MKYVNDLPENITGILLAINEKEMLANGHTLDEVFEANERLINSKLSDIDEAHMIQAVFG